MFSITKLLTGLRLSVTGSATPASLDILPGGTDNTKTTLSAGQTTNQTITLPNRSGEIALTTGSQTLTGTTIDGDNNTLLDISISSLKTEVVDANKVLVRNGAGAVVSAPLVNTNVDAAAAIAYSKLNLSNSIVNADIAAGAAIAASKLAVNTFNVISPNTTKGDITVHNGTTNVRLPVGTNGFVPFADSAQAAGIRWDSVAAGTLDINGLTQTTTVDVAADFIPMYDASVTANRKVTPADFINVNNFTTETVVAQASDFLLMYDASATANRKVTVQNIIKAGTNPTIQRFLSPITATYTTPANVKYIKVSMIGGGGGGCGGGTASAGAGGAGGTTLFHAATCGGGNQSNSNRGGPETSTPGLGIFTGGILINAQPGAAGFNSSTQVRFSGNGGPSFFGGGGRGGGEDGGSATGGASGAGGGGGATALASGSVNVGGGGGGAGSFLEFFVVSPAISYSYTVGVGGNAGTAGTNGFGGGVGLPGYIEVIEYYQ